MIKRGTLVKIAKDTYLPYKNMVGKVVRVTDDVIKVELVNSKDRELVKKLGFVTDPSFLKERVEVLALIIKNE